MRSLFLGLAVALVLAVPATASAATIVVDTTGPGTPATCSLANAIEAANTDSAVNGCPAGGGASDTIEFDLPSPATIDVGSTLAISGNVEIAGPGSAALTISGGDSVRVLQIEPGVLATIADLTIADGRAVLGAGILNEAARAELFRVVLRNNEAIDEGGTDAAAEGGAIFNSGSLTLTRSMVVGNLAKAANGSASNHAAGGGVANVWALGAPKAPTLQVRESTIKNNKATASGGSEASAQGGGLSDEANLFVVGSTLSGNEAVASGGTSSNEATGGGASNKGPAVSSGIKLSTIAGNAVAATSPAGTVAGGGITAYNGLVSIDQTTIAYNSAPSGSNFAGGAFPTSTIIAKPLGGGQNCIGGNTSGGFNLSDDSSCSLTVPWDQNGVDALLAPGLAANGGPTETIALLHGSPAIDQGKSDLGESTDQRGRERPIDIPSIPSRAYGNDADIGAYEVQVPQATITGGPPEGPITVPQQPSFEFAADEAGATFLCSIDFRNTVPCTSPYRVPVLSEGSHTFAVAAVGVAGYAQEPPATRAFTVRNEAPPPPPKAKKAPRTKLSHLPARTTKRRLTLHFSSNQAGSRFTCKLDGRKWRGCRSPYKTPRLALGKHTFRVKAIGPTGVTDPTAVKKTFRVIAPPRGG